MTEAGRRAELLPGDLATEEGCKAAVQGAVNKFGRLDVLVNNASMQVRSFLASSAACCGRRLIGCGLREMR